MTRNNIMPTEIKDHKNFITNPKNVNEKNSHKKEKKKKRNFFPTYS